MCVCVCVCVACLVAFFSPLYHIKTPSTRSRVFSETKTFFSEYGYRPHATGVFGYQKRRFSNTLSRVETFENGDVSYSCGRAKTEVLKYDDVMPRFKVETVQTTIMSG